MINNYNSQVHHGALQVSRGHSGKCHSGIINEEMCPLNKSDVRALDYVVDSALKKIFDTNSKEIILECRLMFDLNSISDVLLKRQRNFLLAYRDLDNNLICHSIAALSAN